MRTIFSPSGPEATILNTLQELLQLPTLSKRKLRDWSLNNGRGATTREPIPIQHTHTTGIGPGVGKVVTMLKIGVGRRGGGGGGGSQTILG